MGVFQNTVDATPATNCPGNGPYADCGKFDRTRIVSPNVAKPVQPGTMVVRDAGETDPRCVKEPASLAELQTQAVGIVQRCADFPEAGYTEGDCIRVREERYSTVVTETAVNYGDTVFVRITQGGAPEECPGNFRNDDAGGEAVEMQNAQFRSTTTAPYEPAIVYHDNATAV